jgi:CTP:molybdopterin cytidylyltransferase MocA
VRVAAVVLAAGASRRLGRPKQAVLLGGETLLERAVRAAIYAAFSPVIVVVREDESLAARLRAKGCEVVVNGQADEGMAASIRCGVEIAQQRGVEGAVLMACDQVGLRAEHLRHLVADGCSVAGSGYAGRVGIPAFFPAAEFVGLLKLRGDVGARELLHGARVVVDETLQLDVDTEAELQRARQIYES